MTEVQKRQHWMQVLAGAGEALYAYEAELTKDFYEVIRAPEVGMTMVRGRMGSKGGAFNLGEMTMTRCVTRIQEKIDGFAYVAGRDKRQAKLAALADAYLQTAAQDYWMDTMIIPLVQKKEAERRQQQAASAASKVEFFTMVRGEVE